MEGWDAPFDTESEESPRVQLARRIADQVETLDGARLARPATCWCWCASAGRCSRRSSARSRAPASPVAGADRLVLTEHIAVMDLMALADALLLPDDDLALASVLKSRCSA